MAAVATPTPAAADATVTATAAITRGRRAHLLFICPPGCTRGRLNSPSLMLAMVIERPREAHQWFPYF
jgi:hypothetical protein